MGDLKKKKTMQRYTTIKLTPCGNRDLHKRMKSTEMVSAQPTDTQNCTRGIKPEEPHQHRDLI